MSEERPDDETNVTDIELMPDGRIFVFGTSLQVLDVLNELGTDRHDELVARLQACRLDATAPSADREIPS